jgi:hypothetical protein
LISFKTDDLVKSLAYLNFDEKVAIIGTYINFIGQEYYIDEKYKINIHRLKSDLSAVSHLQEDISQEEKEDLLKNINPYIESLILHIDRFDDAQIKQDIKDIKDTRDRFAGRNIV